jgi:hypothetical protein
MGLDQQLGVDLVRRLSGDRAVRVRIIAGGEAGFAVVRLDAAAREDHIAAGQGALALVRAGKAAA